MHVVEKFQDGSDWTDPGSLSRCSLLLLLLLAAPCVLADLVSAVPKVLSPAVKSSLVHAELQLLSRRAHTDKIHRKTPSCEGNAYLHPETRQQQGPCNPLE